MIVFEQHGLCFNFRVGGLAIKAGHLLLCYAPDGDFWYLPGGRVEMGEAAQDTLRREVLEELSLESRTGKLLWVVENFFEFAGEKTHELGLYFELELPLEVTDQPILGSERNEALLFRWFLVDKPPNVQPIFIKTEVQNLSAVPKHIIQRDGSLDI